MAVSSVMPETRMAAGSNPGIGCRSDLDRTSRRALGGLSGAPQRTRAGDERGWVRQTYRAEQIPDLYYRPDLPDADFQEADPARAEEDFEVYRAECRAVDAALAGAKLDDTFTFREQTLSVRWMWQHLVEEYARHNGQADLIREAIDGAAGM
jgi:hypothetical protein